MNVRVTNYTGSGAYFIIRDNQSKMPVNLMMFDLTKGEVIKRYLNLSQN